jgi:hypothetical protein
MCVIDCKSITVGNELSGLDSKYGSSVSKVDNTSIADRLQVVNIHSLYYGFSIQA